jgi:hypothetical protein
VTHLLPAAACPETQGLNHRTDLTDPHTVIQNAIEFLPYSQVTLVAVGEEVVVVGILLMGEIMKMTD